jgi:hypothetical protein
VNVRKEKKMETKDKQVTVPTRKVGGKRYTDYDKQDLAVLAAARRWLNSHGLRRFELTDVERARRVEIYRRQVEEHGHITEFLPSPDQRGMKRRRMPVCLPQWRGFAY